MSHSLSYIALHLVFSTKERAKTIPGKLLPELHSVIANIIKQSGGKPIIVGGTTDHVHAVFLLDRSTRPADMVRDIKHKSSRWLSEQPSVLGKFEWQNGYGIFSVGRSQISTLIRYVTNQMEHHRKLSFKQEFLTFLNRYGLDTDPAHLWN